ncbi:hypothetical protein M0R72_12920 [Candidatus Pacearchaeota archaeon]|jgi:hypothetical protein|nr:hypothetical protein [Candidatus Pacearchaeota archaeon]
MRIKKKLLAEHVKKGYSIQYGDGELHLTKNGKHVAYFTVYDTPQMIRLAIFRHEKETQ